MPRSIKKGPKIAPRLRPIQTTKDAIGHPRAAPARVFVKPFGTGKKTSAVKAKITVMEIKKELSLAQVKRFCA